MVPPGLYDKVMNNANSKEKSKLVKLNEKINIVKEKENNSRELGKTKNRKKPAITSSEDEEISDSASKNNKRPAKKRPADDASKVKQRRKKAISEDDEISYSANFVILDD